MKSNFARLSVLALFVLVCSGCELSPFTPATIKATIGSEGAVGANQTWQPFLGPIHRGDKVRVEYLSGQWTHEAGIVAPYDGAGPPHGQACTALRPLGQCSEPLPDFQTGALIGKIGTHEFKIGNLVEVTAQDGGDIMLRMNEGDADLGDNEGEINVRITVEQP